jgi:cell division protein FtsL
MKLFLKILLGIFLAIVLVLGGYLIYLFASYDRLPDNITLKPQNHQNQTLEKK